MRLIADNEGKDPQILTSLTGPASEVMEIIQQDGPVTISEIIKALGSLSSTEVQSIVKGLIREGLVTTEEAVATVQQGGR